MEANRSSEREKLPLLVLDAGQVLISFDFDVAIERLYARTGVRISLPLPEEVERVFREAEINGPAWRQTVKAVEKLVGVSLTESEWAEIWCSIFTGQVPGMEELLRELREDFRIVALSNTCQVHWEYLCKRFPIMKILDGWVVSYEVGAVKPEPGPYLEVMERFGGGKPPLFYTDDMPSFVQAARELGWNAEVFKGADWLAEKVKSLKEGL